MGMFRSAVIGRKERAHLADWMRNLRRAVYMGSGDATALLAAIYEKFCELVAHVYAINEHKWRTLDKN